MNEVLNFICYIIIEATPTLVGAALAFYFGFKLYKKQKREENKAYLHYTASTLSYLNNHLYVFKKYAQKRYEEALNLKSTLEQAIQNQQSSHLQFRETANYIYGADFQLAIGMERLEFLVKRDPNLIILLGTLINSVKSLNHIVTDINSEMSEYSRQSQSPNMQRIMLMLKKNELLYEQLNDTIALNEKFTDLIIRFGVLEYGKEMKIKSSEVKGDEYKKLKPPPIKSWEDYDWLPRKKPWWKKFLKKICPKK